MCGRPRRLRWRTRSTGSGRGTAMLEAARSSRLHAYVVVNPLTGIRTEEARAMQWDHLVAQADGEAGWRPVTAVGFEHEKFAIYVWWSVRAHGDTKTEKSRRTLELPRQAAETFRRHHARQAAQRLRAGEECRITASCSARPPGGPWTPPTCGGRSGSSRRRRGSERVGRRGDCGTRSCRSRVTAVCRSRRSRTCWLPSGLEDRKRGLG